MPGLKQHVKVPYLPFTVADECLVKQMFSDIWIGFGAYLLWQRWLSPPLTLATAVCSVHGCSAALVLQWLQGMHGNTDLLLAKCSQLPTYHCALEDSSWCTLDSFYSVRIHMTQRPHSACTPYTRGTNDAPISSLQVPADHWNVCRTRCKTRERCAARMASM